MAKDLTAETDETFSDALDILLDANFAYLVTKQAPLVSTNSADAARTLQYLAPLPALVARNDYMSLISNNTADRQLPDVDMVSLDERIPVITPSTPTTPVVPETPPAEQVVPIDDAEPDSEPDSEAGDTGDSSGGADTDTETDDDAVNVAAQYRCIAIGFVSGEALNLTPADVTTTATDEINFIDSFSSWKPHTLVFGSAASWRDNLIITRPDLDQEITRATGAEAALSQALDAEKDARADGDAAEAERINERIGLDSEVTTATVGASTEGTLIDAVDAELNRVADEHLALAKQYSNSRLGEIIFNALDLTHEPADNTNIKNASIKLTLPVTSEATPAPVEADPHTTNTLTGTKETTIDVTTLAGQLQDVAVISEAKTNEQTNEQTNEWQLKFTWNAAADNKTDAVTLKEIVRPEFFTTTVAVADGKTPPDRSNEGIPYLAHKQAEINKKFNEYFTCGTGLFADSATTNPQIRIKIDPEADVYTTYTAQGEIDFNYTPYLQITDKGLKLTGINQRVGELNNRISSNVLTVKDNGVFNEISREATEEEKATTGEDTISEQTAVEGARLSIAEASTNQLHGKKLSLVLPKYITPAELQKEINQLFSGSSDGGGFTDIGELSVTLGALSNKLDTHSHDGKYSDVGHNHDDRYDNKYSSTGHTHTSLSDGTYTVGMPAKSGTVALTADIPAELPNPNKLTIAYGSTSVDYDGSAAKSITIDASSIGAAESTHTHNYASATHTHDEYVTAKQAQEGYAEKNHDHDDYVTADYLTEHNYVSTVYLTGQNYVTTSHLAAQNYVTTDYLAGQNYVTSSSLEAQNYVTSGSLAEQLAGKQSDLGIASIGDGLNLTDKVLTVAVSTATGNNSLSMEEDGLSVQIPEYSLVKTDDNTMYYLAKNDIQVGDGITIPVIPTYTGDAETDSLVTITVDNYKISATLADTVLTTADIGQNIASYDEVKAVASTVGGHVYDIESLQSELAALKQLVSTQYTYKDTIIEATCGCCHASGQISLEQADDEENNPTHIVKVTASGILQNTGYKLALYKDASEVATFEGIGSKDFDLSANIEGEGNYELYCWFETTSLEDKYSKLVVVVPGTNEPSTEPDPGTEPEPEPDNNPTEGEGEVTEGTEGEGGNTDAGGDNIDNTEQTQPTE
jgi:hypothetical protein